MRLSSTSGLRLLCFVLVFVVADSSVAAWPDSGEGTPQQETATPQQPQWKWTDIELMGHRSVSREEILKHIPLKAGTPFAADRPQWMKWEKDLQQQFGFHAVHISAVRFVGGKGYLVVNIVETAGDAASFREQPTGSVEIPDNLLDAYRTLSEYQQQLFEKGTPSPENGRNGFLDYRDPELSRLAKAVVRVAEGHRKLLLKVIAEDANAENRAKAATLLNWAGETQTSMQDVLPFLNDPSMGVRNNLTRFMLHYFDQIESIEVKRAITDAVVPQLDWPSHGDRNKAIYALLNLSKDDPEAVAYIGKKAGDRIRYIAENSILFNVRDPAREMLERIGAGETDDR